MAEHEVKFYIKNLPTLQSRIESIRAFQVKARVYEYNLRFDDAVGSLVQAERVLRLRKDLSARVTYKGPGIVQEGVSVRSEIEFQVSDFAAAKRLFELLGYEVAFVYEKFRTTYHLDNIELVVDEMPLGNFIELEGPDGSLIQDVAEKLGLNWEHRVIDSYWKLFQMLRNKLKFQFRDLLFENFADLNFTPEIIGVFPADGIVPKREIDN